MIHARSTRVEEVAAIVDLLSLNSNSPSSRQHSFAIIINYSQISTATCVMHNGGYEK